MPLIRFQRCAEKGLICSYLEDSKPRGRKSLALDLLAQKQRAKLQTSLGTTELAQTSNLGADEQTTISDFRFQPNGLVPENMCDSHDQAPPVIPVLHGDQDSPAPPCDNEVEHSRHSAPGVEHGIMGPLWRPDTHNQLLAEQIDDIIPIYVVHSVIDCYFAQVS